VQRLAQVVARRGEELAFRAARFLRLRARRLGLAELRAQQAYELLFLQQQLLVGEAKLDRFHHHPAALAHENQHDGEECDQEQRNEPGARGVRVQPGKSDLREERGCESDIGAWIGRARRQRSRAPAAHHHGEERLPVGRERFEEKQRRASRDDAADRRQGREAAFPCLGVAGERRAAPQGEDQDRSRDQYADGEHRPPDDGRQRHVAPREVCDVRAQHQDRKRQPQPLPAQQRELLGTDAARELGARVPARGQRCAWRDRLLDSHGALMRAFCARPGPSDLNTFALEWPGVMQP
jgi:hypothetical protein